jgi:hypothetical protein
MKRIITVIFVVIFLSLVVLSDFFTTPPTHDMERDAATAYIATNKLPTPPRPFTHDGCTLFPDSILWHDFYPACINHDIGYWAGGDTTLREEVDLTFYTDIKETGPLGYVFAPLMYIGVRCFGNTFVARLADANWGYGWNASD